MTWIDIGHDSLEAAKLLRDAERHRSSVSRSYYAAYARVTGLLVPAASLAAIRAASRIFKVLEERYG